MLPARAAHIRDSVIFTPLTGRGGPAVGRVWPGFAGLHVASDPWGVVTPTVELSLSGRHGQPCGSEPVVDVALDGGRGSAQLRWGPGAVRRRIEGRGHGRGPWCRKMAEAMPSGSGRMRSTGRLPARLPHTWPYDGPRSPLPTPAPARGRVTTSSSSRMSSSAASGRTRPPTAAPTCARTCGRTARCSATWPMTSISPRHRCRR